jgi:hypothetical protein
LRQHYPRPLIAGACLILLVANVFNIAADLGGMAEAAAMLTGLPALPFVVVFGVGITAITVYTSYATFAHTLKWLTAVLFAYWRGLHGAPALAGCSWPPSCQPARTGRSVSTLVGILGTTISPYLFFWQATQEVEEQKSQGKKTIAQRRGATSHELADARLDVNTGMFFSNLVMYFIILATASTLHRAGVQDIETARQAAEALRPLAGDAAYVLFAAGLVGTGLLAIPVLAGSASFAVAELVAGRPRSQAAERPPLLSRLRECHGRRHCPQPPRRQRDADSLLLRRAQRPPRSPAHGPGHAGGRQPEDHGRARQRLLAEAARLDGDRGHGRGRARVLPDVGELKLGRLSLRRPPGSRRSA